MTDFEANERGILLPIAETPSDARDDRKDRGYTDEPQGHNQPVLAGWTFSKCDERFYRSDDIDFRKSALEILYIAIDPGGGRLINAELSKERQRLTQLVDELAVALVGGTPECCEQFT